MIKKMFYTGLFLLSTLSYAQINSVEYDLIRSDDFLDNAMTHVGSPYVFTRLKDLYSDKLQDAEKELKIWAKLIETSPSGRELNLAIKGIDSTIQRRNNLLKKLGKDE